MIQINEKNNINKKLSDSLYSIRIEKEKIKEQLTSRNKQIYSLGIKNKTYNIYYLTNIKITAIILKFIKNV